MRGKGFLVFLLVIILLAAAAYGGWFFWARWNAKRNGLPPPSPNPIAAFKNRSGGGVGGGANYPGPASGGIKGVIGKLTSRFSGNKNRSAAGAYEETTYETGQTRGRGAGSRLDPDETWSARVGDEAYYEEQELGLHNDHHDDHHGPSSSNPYGNSSYRGAPYGGDTSYGGGGAAILSPTEPARGRSRTRESYDEHGNPFGDENAASLRNMSPRPHADDTSYHGGATVQMPSIPTHKKAGSIHSMDQSSRKSVFREDM